MRRVTASIDLPAPPETVWELVMDPRRLHEWVTIHRRLDRADAGGPRKGFEMEQRLHLLGANLKVAWTLVECEPARLAVWEGHGPARSRAHSEYKLTPADGGTTTRFQYSNEFQPPLGPLGAVLTRALVGGVAERETTRSLERLRELVARSVTTPSKS